MSLFGLITPVKFGLISRVRIRHRGSDIPCQVLSVVSCQDQEPGTDCRRAALWWGGPDYGVLAGNPSDTSRPGPSAAYLHVVISRHAANSDLVQLGLRLQFADIVEKPFTVV